MLAPPDPSHPLPRTRPKDDPDPGWERISWDEALSLTAAMPRSAISHGPEGWPWASLPGSTGFIRRLANAALIANGDWVSIETPEGSVRARARLNHSLDPDIVVGEHGWWQACAEVGAPGCDPFGPDGANLNLTIGTAALDPVSGTASHRSYLCENGRAA